MPLSTDALTSWETAKVILNLLDDQQAMVEFLINAASAYANRRAGRKLRGRAVSLRLDGTGCESLTLPEWPASVSNIWIDETRAFAEGEALDPATFHVDEESGIIRLFDYEFPNTAACVRVDGSLGYSTIPADLEQAVLECVAANLRRLGSPGAIGLKNVSVDGATSSAYEVDWPTTAVMVFDSYRRRHV
ncbi:MAG: hypothetical protein RBT68_11650 [Spirochaetia bacterium]|jgi:hypothetical protein|nr:hypothetical protein [Spirochaetia bacterium]